MMLGRITKRLVRVFSDVQTTQGSAVIEPKPTEAAPVHLRPYDKSKYEVIMDKIKLNSGTMINTQAMPSWRWNPSPEPRS
jgi:hypothetical protein